MSGDAFCYPLTSGILTGVSGLNSSWARFFATWDPGVA
nr:MAG TPA: hypothetical protein [Caudoviricetes sp.]